MKTSNFPPNYPGLFFKAETSPGISETSSGVPVVVRDELNTADALTIALGMYVGEPCRICGKTMTEQAVDAARFAGYSADGKSRIAHRECFGMQHASPETWAH